MTFDEALEHVFRYEGGWSDHPDDPGGATKYGITRGTLSKWRGYKVSKDEVRELTRNEARTIYKEMYWEPIQGDHWQAGLAFLMFDTAVNQGVGRAVRFLQKACGSKVDGIIGPNTRGRVAGSDYDSLVRDFCVYRALHYSGLIKFTVFGKGWMRRLFDAHRIAVTA